MVRLAQAYVRTDRRLRAVSRKRGLAYSADSIGSRRVRHSKPGFLASCSTAHASRARLDRAACFSAITNGAEEPFEPTVEPSRFQGPNDRFPGGWRSFPPTWDEVPDQRLLAAETRQHLQSAIESLPPQQREVVILRDVHGCSADEVCSVLQLSAANQRVLLHRGRARVRHMLAQYLTGD